MKFGSACSDNRNMQRLDERGIIASWLVRLVIGFALVGVVLFDGGAIAVNYFGLDSAANQIAVAVSVNVADRSISGPQQLENAARELARERSARLIRAEIDDEGVVHIELRRRADTLLVSRISAIEDWGVASATASSGTRPAT